MSPARRLPVGVEVVADGRVHARVWAPKRRRVDLVLEDDQGREMAVGPLAAEDGGYFSGYVGDVRAGSRYRFRLDGEADRYPDPASRFQPGGPHEASQVIDPAFEWTDGDWRGVGATGQVIYELHIGTFTPEGTWAAAERELPELAALGVTVIELMPVAEFAGRFGWGYDGVDLFAPTRLYGTPDDFRRFVNAAHGAGLGVILDVVYNHLGPAGNYLRQYADEYFSATHKTEWGDAMNFDGPGCRAVREFFLANACYWVEEFHLDGLRLDATQSVFDDSGTPILAEIVETVRAAAGARSTLVVGENEPQQASLVRPRDVGGCGLDALWNDDFHHAAMVAATGRNEAYYTDYAGSARELVAAAKYGYLYQGQYYRWQKKRRGTPAFDVPPWAFIHYLQNHDQVANSAAGLRLDRLTSPGRYRALTALLLLLPQTPMLFMGQEFAATAPFLYFADHEPELAKAVRSGRAEFLGQFSSIATPEVRRTLPDPGDPQTFERCKLDLAERERHAAAYALHRDLIAMRRSDPVFRAPRVRGLDGVALTASAFALRFFSESGDDRLVVVNLGLPVEVTPVSDPLLAPPRGRWARLWTSDDPRYGGLGATELELGRDSATPGVWRILGEGAVVLRPGEE